MYEYRVEVDRVVDGDTVDFIVDLGFNVKLKERFRLAGINAPESRTKDLEEKERGLSATKFLELQLSNLIDLKIVTDKDAKGKYGRWLGTIWGIDAVREEWVNVNEFMVTMGHAVHKEY